MLTDARHVESSSSKSSQARWRVPLDYELRVSVAFAAFAAVLAFWRIPEPVRDTLWAEDGALFLADALQGGVSLLKPYAGYLHVASRATSAIASRAPLDAAAAVSNGLACAWNGLAAAVVYYCSRGAFPRRAPRVFVAASSVLLPLMPVEVAGNLANLHGYFVWSAFWLLWCPPRSRREAAFYSAWMVLATLSEVQTIALTPLVVWFFATRPSWRQRSVLVAFALGVAAELWAMNHSPRAGVDQRALPPLLPLLELYGTEVAMPLWWVDSARIGALVSQYGSLVRLCAALPLLGAVGLALAFGDTRARWLTLVSSGLSLGLFTLAHAANYGACMREPDCVTTIRVLNRYGPIPSLFALVPVAVLLHVATQRGKSVLRALSWVMTAPLAVSAGLHFQVDESRRFAAHAWAPQVPGARADCAAAGAPSQVCLAISPRRWKACIPCSVVRQAQ